jgi:BirA family biotin operon repressor/biotin-[acetyl-CoA-carboxylase] ligase
MRRLQWISVLNSNPRELNAPERLPDDLIEALDAARGDMERIGSPMLWFSSTESTNDIAWRLGEGGRNDGAVVIAETQTAGRGRLGRTWFSPAGSGLYVSVVFQLSANEAWGAGQGPESAPSAIPLPARLTLLAGVALAEAVRTATGLPAEIKWPNDLVFGGRKLAGILAEASAQSGTVEYIVLGIGINVRQVSYPPEIALRASSLEAELGRPADRGAVLAALLVNLGQARLALLRDEVGPWFERWRQMSPSARGADVEWRAPDGVRRGRTAGLDCDGALLVQSDRGIEHVCAGEVIWL